MSTEHAELVRCAACRHDPGPGRLCHRARKHANRAPRRCEQYEAAGTCGDCRHRSPTGICYAVTNRERHLVRVGLGSAPCGLFEVRKRWVA